MNRNAARHLALVVSILLCFFVYMGYRFWGKSESVPSEPDDITAVDGGIPIESFADDSSSSSFVPPPVSPPPTQGATGGLRPPGSDVSLPLTGPDSGNGGISLAPPPSGMPPPPSGSIEASSPDSITGLVPAPPLTPLGSGAGSVVPPPSGDGRDDDEAPSSLAPPSPGFMPPPAGTSAPSSPLSPPSTSPPPAGDRQGTPPSSSVQPPSGRQTVPPTRTPEPAGQTAPPSRQQGTPPIGLPSGPSQGSGQSPSGSVRPGGSDPLDQAGDRDNEPVSETLRIYVVQPGDTLSRIATRELGSIALADNIFLLNRDVIPDPDHLMAGVRIRLPMRESLGPSVNGGSSGIAAPQSAGPRLHRVQRGETLSAIALQYYGSSAAWRTVYEANRNVIPNPNQLQVGMELTIPPYAE